METIAPLKNDSEHTRLIKRKISEYLKSFRINRKAKITKDIQYYAVLIYNTCLQYSFELPGEIAKYYAEKRIA